MIIIDNILDAAFPNTGTVLTIGSFDGVHLGHRRILDEVKRHAEERNLTSAVITFKPHPRQFFSPGHAPNLLTCDTKKQALLCEAGMDAVLILPFDAEVAAMEPEEFVRRVLVERCNAKAVVVGHDFRFGNKARGDFELLAELAERQAIEVAQAPALLIDGERVSSTFIREQLMLGDLETVLRFLGRPYSVTGIVNSGQQIGSTLGFPTANIRPYHSAMPGIGVYVAEARWRDQRFPAAVNIGVAPTIRNRDLTMEAFILDFSHDLVGETLEVVFLKRLRDEQRFPSVQHLIAQIQQDVTAVRAYFAAQKDSGVQ
ncbi:MAG: riboflavin biosynthesis protein [Candidatus Hydrogenedentota bacterium]